MGVGGRVATKGGDELSFGFKEGEVAVVVGKEISIAGGNTAVDAARDSGERFGSRGLNRVGGSVVVVVVVVGGLVFVL